MLVVLVVWASSLVVEVVGAAEVVVSGADVVEVVEVVGSDDEVVSAAEAEVVAATVLASAALFESEPPALCLASSPFPLRPTRAGSMMKPWASVAADSVATSASSILAERMVCCVPCEGDVDGLVVEEKKNKGQAVPTKGGRAAKRTSVVGVWPHDLIFFRGPESASDGFGPSQSSSSWSSST